MTNDRPFGGALDLANSRLGGKAVAASDDFFAAKERINDPADPVFIADKYDDNGKWMDGWESRRRRDAGHDWCVIRLAARGRLLGAEFDTRHFTGNYAPAAQLEGCVSDSEIPGADAVWTPLTPAITLNGDERREVAIEADAPVTHVRLNIYPDGGVARLRLFGVPDIDWSARDAGERMDLASALNGARVIACNDEHFGRLANILAPGRGVNMGDGWETRRRREPGADWGLIELARPGRIEEILIDTAHFKGNFPDRCSLQAIGGADVPAEALIAQSLFWPMLLPEQKMTADAEHRFTSKILSHEPVRYIRLNLAPDGGVSRLRLFGRAS
ncbi:MAG: allantoicase [Pseudomonadota bacterium]